MIFVTLFIGFLIWFLFYFDLTGRFGRAIYINNVLYLKKHLLKRNSVLHKIFFEECNNKVPHIDTSAYSLLFGLLCNLCILIICIVHVSIGVSSSSVFDHPLNMAIGILLLIQFVVFFVTHFIVSNESTKCNHETAIYTNIELKGLIKEIEKEYPKFYKKNNKGSAYE